MILLKMKEDWLPKKWLKMQEFLTDFAESLGMMHDSAKFNPYPLTWEKAACMWHLTSLNV